MWYIVRDIHPTAMAADACDAWGRACAAKRRWDGVLPASRQLGGIGMARDAERERRLGSPEAMDSWTCARSLGCARVVDRAAVVQARGVLLSRRRGGDMATSLVPYWDGTVETSWTYW